MTANTQSTIAIYDALIARIVGFTPAVLVLPGQSVPVPLSTVLGARVWMIQAKDNPTFPYVTLRLMGRHSDDTTHGGEQQFSLEVDCWHRPRSRDTIALLSGIADQIEAGLVDWMMPNDVLMIRSLRTRESRFAYQSPADRDVCREYLMLDGFMWPSYVGQETGVGR